MVSDQAGQHLLIPTKASADCAVPAYRGVNETRTLRAGRGGGGPDASIEIYFNIFLSDSK